MDLELQGKVAIVTGGALGIGASIVETLVKEGANVIIADNNFEAAQQLVEKITTNGSRVLAIKTNVDQANKKSQ